MPKKLLWFVALALAGIFYVLWDAGRVPARVTLMNQAATPVYDVTLTTEHERIEIGTLRPGTSRAVPLEAADRVELSYRWAGATRRWRSEEPVRAGQPLVLYLTAEGRVTPRSRLGTLGR